MSSTDAGVGGGGEGGVGPVRLELEFSVASVIGRLLASMTATERAHVCHRAIERWAERTSSRGGAGVELLVEGASDKTDAGEILAWIRERTGGVPDGGKAPGVKLSEVSSRFWRLSIGRRHAAINELVTRGLVRCTEEKDGGRGRPATMIYLVDPSTRDEPTKDEPGDGEK